MSFTPANVVSKHERAMRLQEQFGVSFHDAFAALDCEHPEEVIQLAHRLGTSIAGMAVEVSRLERKRRP